MVTFPDPPSALAATTGSDIAAVEIAVLAKRASSIHLIERFSEIVQDLSLGNIARLTELCTTYINRYSMQ